MTPVYYQRERTAEFLNGIDPKDPALWVTRADGKRRRRLLARSPSDLLWVGSGGKLLLPGTGQLVDVNTGNTEVIHSQQESLTSQLSSIPEGVVMGGTLLFRSPIDYAVTEKDGSYWRIHLLTKRAVQLAAASSRRGKKEANTEIVRSALASPDGRRLAYVEAIKQRMSVLKVLNLQDQTSKTFEFGQVFINHFEWSPKGNQLLVEQYEGASGGPWSTVFTVDLETNQQHSIDVITSDTAPWSPSGRWLAYQTLPTVRSLEKNSAASADIGVWSTDIGVVKADGSAKSYLTAGAVFACLPRWITVTPLQ